MIARRKSCALGCRSVCLPPWSAAQCALVLVAVAPVLAQCPADVNGDGGVGGTDLSIVLSAWSSNGQGQYDADINNDGIVDGSDLTSLLSAWGNCAPAVPAWATLLEATPNPNAVHNEATRAAIAATGYAWRVRHTATQVEMVLIPPGTFDMGCSPTPQSGCWPEENPVHQVTLTQPFYLGRYEVTQAQWTAVMGSNPSHFQGASYPDAANRPVERINYNDAKAFVDAAGMRLPTEAEWEYAYRAGTRTAFHSMPGFPNGTDDESKLQLVAWIGINSGMQTRPIGLKPGNGFGIHDIAGNVLEWTNDWYGDYPSTPQVDPTGVPSAWGRVFRSGCWHLGPWLSRVSVRFEDEPEGLRVSDTGLRVAKNP